MLAYLPTYFAAIGVPLELLGFYVAPPYVCLALFGNLCSAASDGLINRGIWSITRARKVFQTVGFVGPAVVAVVIALLGFDAFRPWVLSVTFSVGMTLCSFSRAGFWVNHYDIGGFYAPHLMGNDYVHCCAFV